ncbi:hypothetical protein MTO96_010295 [Rhipicephalus appendiculatus]
MLRSASRVPVERVGALLCKMGRRAGAGGFRRSAQNPPRGGDARRPLLRMRHLKNTGYPREERGLGSGSFEEVPRVFVQRSAPHQKLRLETE